MILEGETFVQKATQKSLKTTCYIGVSERLPIAKIAFLQFDVFSREKLNPRRRNPHFQNHLQTLSFFKTFGAIFAKSAPKHQKNNLFYKGL